MKKKAIKIAAASAVAASAFVASPAFAANNGTSVITTVDNAVVQMSKAYHTYSDVTATGKFADINAVYKQYNAAKAAYASAKAVVVKAGGAQKDAYLAKLDDAYKTNLTDRVVPYIDAYNYAINNLVANKVALQNAIDAKDIANVYKYYNEISYQLKVRTVILDRVYGQTTRELLRSSFKADAQALRDSMQYDVTVGVKIVAVKDALAAGKLDVAKVAVDQINLYLPKITDTFKAELTKAAKDANDAYEATQTPKVTSVTALNSTQLVVKFNKELDKTDVTADKFKVEGQAAPTVSLADDNKTVTLTYANVEGNALAIVVEPIKTKADAKVSTERYVSKLTYTDTVTPSVSKVDYTYSADGKTATAKFTFSEPLFAAGTVSVNGLAVTPATLDLAKGEVSVSGLEVGKTYKVDFVGTTDVAKNIANPITQTITVPAQVKDEVKPVASVSISANKVTLQFSEEVSTIGTVTINGTDYTSSFVKDTNGKTKYVLDAQAAGALNAVNFLNATVVVDGYKDNATVANAGEKVTTTGTLTADRTAPSFVSATVSSDNSKILLTFNDEVKAGDLTGADELVLKAKDGVTITNQKVDLTAANVAYGYDLDGKDGIKDAEKNIVAIANPLAAKSSYTFDLVGKVVADSYSNKVADTLTFSLNVGEVAPGTANPQAIVAFTNVAAAGNVITVNYNKEMGDSALVASNYRFAGQALPSNATLKFVNSRNIVEITLPAGSVAVNGTYVLEVTGVADKVGNTLANGKASSSFYVGETVAPTATKVTVDNSKQFTVDFSEALAAAAKVDGVTVKVNGTTVDATVAVVGGKLVVTTAKDFAQTDAITVEFKDTNLADANGNKVANTVISK